jgi:integrase
MRTEIQPLAESTIASYRRLTLLLLRHSDRMKNAGRLGLVTDFALRLAFAFEDLEPRITAASARLYRAAATNAISSNPGDRDTEALAILQPEPSEEETYRVDKLAEMRASNLTTLRGAQQKAKWVSGADWKRLLSALGRRDSMWAEPAIDWLAAGLVVGLRPCEWQHATFNDGKLCVQNAKATNGRAHGPERTIDVSRSSRLEQEVVERFLSRVQEAGEDGYRQLYDGVRNLIRVVAREEFLGRRVFPTLYSARHVFAARAKATYPKDVVAALLGHASLVTAGRHYALARHARGGKPLDAQPAVADVEAVRRANVAKSILPSPGNQRL